MNQNTVVFSTKSLEIKMYINRALMIASIETFLCVTLLFYTVVRSEELHEHPTILNMLKVNNEHRKRNGLSPHQLSPELCKAAQNHAKYMANGGAFSHYANGGYQGRARKFKYPGSVRENIAYGQHGVTSVFSTWMNSGGHRASILSDTQDAGFGLAYSGGTPYWVGIYGYSQ